MAVTIAPSVEAMDAIVDRINSASSYILDIEATASELIIDEMEDISGIRVDVATEDELQLSETLAVEDRTSHTIRIWIRAKVDDNRDTSSLKLLVREIFQRINNFNSADGRVKVWECDIESKQNPDKAILNQQGLFVSSITLRVEVEAS